MAEPMVLGPVDGLNVDQRDFFNAAKSGNKKMLKKLVDSGKIHDVDMTNELGQTPLFFACFDGAEECVKYLLEKGANPNEPTEEGQTPLHAACFHACIKSVSALIERGGDFRFNDKEQRTAKDWAMLNPNAKKRQLMTEYIVKTRMFAMTHSGRDVLLEQQSSIYMRRPSDNAGSMAQLFKRISSKGGGKGEHIRTSASLMSLGYGKVYGGEKGGTFSTIPMIAESMLKHDDFGTTFMNSAFFVMEGMMLGPTKVTVKRLHHEPPKGGVVDLLIRECENIAHLRHPSVLLLMATCATDNMEGMVLLFERVCFGSLYNYLHEKKQQPAPHAIIEAGLQLCEGLIYIHQNNFIHCYVSSHSLFLTNCNTLKMGNFEYMVPMTIGGRAARLPGVASNKYRNAAYNWMSPEIIKGELPTDKSDIYSFCAVMWEMFTGNIPWVGHDAEQIKRQVCNNKMLKVNDSHIPLKFVEVLTYGLQPSVGNRRMNFEQIRDVLSLMPRGRPDAGKHASPTAQTNNHCSVDIYDTFLGSSFVTSGGDTEGSRILPSRNRNKKQRKRHYRADFMFDRHTQTWDPNEAVELIPYDAQFSDRTFVNVRKMAVTPPLAPQRKKRIDVTSNSLTTFSFLESENLFNIQSYNVEESGNSRHNRQTQDRLCIALKAPIHEELKMYYTEIRKEMLALEHARLPDRENEFPINILNPQQLTLQKQLNQELHDIFSGFGKEFASLDLSEFDDIYGSTSATDFDTETIPSAKTDVPPTRADNRSAWTGSRSFHVDALSAHTVNCSFRANNPLEQADNPLVQADNPTVQADNLLVQADNRSTRPDNPLERVYRPPTVVDEPSAVAYTEVAKHNVPLQTCVNTRMSKSMSNISADNSSNELMGPPKETSLRTSCSSTLLPISSLPKEAVKPASHTTVGRQMSSSASQNSQSLISVNPPYNTSSFTSQPQARSRSRRMVVSPREAFPSNHKGGSSGCDEELACSTLTLIKAASLPSAHIEIPSLKSENGASQRQRSHRQRFEPYQLVNSCRGDETGESSSICRKYQSGTCKLKNALRTASQPQVSANNTSMPLRYIGKSTAITEQVPVVDRIKKLDKQFGKCHSSEVALDRFKASYREYEQSAMCTSLPSQYDNKPMLSGTISSDSESHKSNHSVHVVVSRTKQPDFSEKKRIFEHGCLPVNHYAEKTKLDLTIPTFKFFENNRGRAVDSGNVFKKPVLCDKRVEECGRNGSSAGANHSYYVRDEPRHPGVHDWIHCTHQDVAHHAGVKDQARQPGVEKRTRRPVLGNRTRQPVVGNEHQQPGDGACQPGVGDGACRHGDGRFRIGVCQWPASPSVSNTYAEDTSYDCDSNLLNTDTLLRKDGRPASVRRYMNEPKRDDVPTRSLHSESVTDGAIVATNSLEADSGQMLQVQQTEEELPLNVLAMASTFQMLASRHEKKQLKWSRSATTATSEYHSANTYNINLPANSTTLTVAVPADYYRQPLTDNGDSSDPASPAQLLITDVAGHDDPRCSELSTTISDALTGNVSSSSNPSLPEIPLRASDIIQAINSAAIDKEKPEQKSSAAEMPFLVRKQLVQKTNCAEARQFTLKPCGSGSDSSSLTTENTEEAGRLKFLSHCGAKMQQSEQRGYGQLSTGLSEPLVFEKKTTDVHRFATYGCEGGSSAKFVSDEFDIGDTVALTNSALPARGDNSVRSNFDNNVPVIASSISHLSSSASLSTSKLREHIESSALECSNVSADGRPSLTIHDIIQENGNSASSMHDQLKNNIDDKVTQNSPQDSGNIPLPSDSWYYSDDLPPRDEGRSVKPMIDLVPGGINLNRANGASCIPEHTDLGFPVGRSGGLLTDDTSSQPDVDYIDTPNLIGNIGQSLTEIAENSPMLMTAPALNVDVTARSATILDNEMGVGAGKILHEQSPSSIMYATPVETPREEEPLKCSEYFTPSCSPGEYTTLLVDQAFPLAESQLYGNTTNDETFCVDQNNNPVHLAEVSENRSPAESQHITSESVSDTNTEESSYRTEDSKMSYKYNLTANYQLLDSEENERQQVEILCETTPRLPRVTTVGSFSGAAKAFVTQADEDTAHIILQGENGRSRCKVKLNRTHTVTRRQDGTDIVITKHDISTEISSVTDKDSTSCGYELTHTHSSDKILEAALPVSSPALDTNITDSRGEEVVAAKSETMLKYRLEKRSNPKPILNELAAALPKADLAAFAPGPIDENNNVEMNRNPPMSNRPVDLEATELDVDQDDKITTMARDFPFTADVDLNNNGLSCGSGEVRDSLAVRPDLRLSSHSDVADAAESALFQSSLEPSSHADVLRCRTDDLESLRSHSSEITDYLDLPSSLQPSLFTHSNS